jgi:hypothetical protein
MATSAIFSMLAGCSASGYLAARSASVPSHARCPVPLASAADEMGMLQAMSDSFWKQKRARLKADLAAQLLELDEFEAREKALQQVSGGGTIGGSPALAQLEAELEAERARSAMLEEQLQAKMLEAEVNMQKVSAYWINKLAEAKGALPAGAEAPSLAAAAAAPPGEDLVSDEADAAEELEKDLSLRELRARLLSFGLSTTGVKSELRERLQYAVLHQRLQHKSWDVATLSWK